MKAFRLLLAVASILVLLVGPANAMITFSEFAVGTVITNQYAPQGVIFGSGPVGNSNPIIANDGGFQVLSPNPPYAGDFYMYFVNPATWVEFDAGVWNDDATGIIKVYDPWGGSLGSFTNTQDWDPGDPFVYEHFTFSGLGQIGSIYFNSNDDVAGAAIDNLDFNAVPEPGTLALLGAGLAGVAALRRRMKK